MGTDLGPKAVLRAGLRPTPSRDRESRATTSRFAKINSIGSRPDSVHVIAYAKFLAETMRLMLETRRAQPVMIPHRRRARDYVERAQSSLAIFTAQCERAPNKALTFVRS